MVKRWFIVLALIGLASCGLPLNDSRKSAIRNLAVISAIGDDVSLSRIFGDDEKPERLQWSFDKIASNAVIEKIRSSNPGIEIISLDYDSNDLADKINKSEPFRSFSDPARIDPELRQLTNGKPIDTLIVIARDDFSQGALLSYEGVGILTERTLLPRAPVTPYAVLSMFVIEVPSMRVITKQGSHVKGRVYNVTPLVQFSPIGGPAPFLPGFEFPMDNDQKEFLRPLLQELVLTSTRQLMQRSGF